MLRREPPNARKGKAEALNDAYRTLGRLLGDVDRRDVIVVVVDADGRVDAQAPRYAAAHFRDPGSAACSRSCGSTTATRC